MKSRQRKKLAKRQGEIREAAREARDNDPHLMALHMCFIPSIFKTKKVPKFTSDKYGNRVLTEGLKVNG